jgi:NADPH2:quinone reductase
VVVPPGDWSIEESAAAPLVYLTAFQALTQWGEFPPSIVLISGASGGVGVASIQLARALGHRVIALSRSGQKKIQLQKIGAELVFDPTQSDWPKKLKEAISPSRVNLAIDNIGGEMFTQILETLGDHGRVSVVGRLAGPVPQFNTSSLFFRRLRIGGVAVGAYKPAESRQAWESVVKFMAQIQAKPLVDHVFEFDKLPAAFARLHDGPVGKVLLRIA